MNDRAEFRKAILAMYHNRCVVCGTPSRIVHEIIPRSRLPRTWAMIDNAVVLCKRCHDEAHESTVKSEKMLRYVAERMREIYSKEGSTCPKHQ